MKLEFFVRSTGLCARTRIKNFKFAKLVGPSGLEPPTSRLSGVRSNHLSYEPIFSNALGSAFSLSGFGSRFALPNLSGSVGSYPQNPFPLH